MLEASVKNMQGKEVKKISLSESVFAAKENKALLHQVIVSLQANKRQGNHATKTRAFVAGGGRKPLRQKGTGSARQGSRRSPLMRGGAVVHGPNPRSYRHAIPQKIKNHALKIVLSDRFQNGTLHIIDKIDLHDYKTKTIASLLKTFNINKVLLSDDRQDDYLYRSARNIYRTEAVMAMNINALDVMSHDNLLITEAGIHALNKRIVGEEA